MSKAGQNNFTGISDQADIALFYLLQANRMSDFQEIIIEGRKWEDFTFVFDTHNEDYEVKSHKKPLSFSGIRKIIIKKLNKQYGEKDKFKIVVRKLNKKFRDCYEYIHDYIHWIEAKGLKRNSTAKKFLDKKWLESEVLFLARVEIVEFSKIENIHQQILEYFVYEYPFYLDPTDQRSIVAQFFKDIMEKGKCGGVITQKDFRDKLTSFEEHIADCPTKFDPKLPIGRRILNIRDFLCSPEKLKELNRKIYLSQLTTNPRFVFYLCDELEKSDFHVDDFIFFIDNILLRQHYVRLVLRILEKKWAQNKVTLEYLIDFVISNYKKLSYDFNYDDALRILKDTAQKDTEGKFEQKIINFLKKEILLPFKKGIKKRFQRGKRGWREDEQVAEILKIFLERTKNKKDFIDLIFDYFDFTRDDFEGVIETHPIIYSFVKDFIKENLEKNFEYVVRKISEQFNVYYNGKYKGYEWIGSGIAQSGGSYSITDIGVVRLLFQPLFLALYNENHKEVWQFLRKKILEKVKKEASENNPIYLKRALIPILLARLEDNKLKYEDKESTYEYLKNVLCIRGGIPGTSEIIFSELRRKDLNKIGFEKVMELISIDSIKYRRKNYQAGYPTNLFVISTLIKLIKLGYLPAREFYITLIKKPDFIKHEQHYDSFELLLADGIPENAPDFLVEIFYNLDFEKYLNTLREHNIWNKSGIITELIKRDWKDGTDRGERIINALLKDKIPSKNVLEFLGGPIRNLAQLNALETYKLFQPYLESREGFRTTFHNKHTRQDIVWLADELAKQNHYAEAKKIVELCIDDPDPETHNREEDFNYHLQIKQGKERIVISTVRGTVAWVLQKFVVTDNPKLMEYALEKTNILLDLDGKLARQLGYSEPDLYVRKQALVPLIELSYLWRRKKLSEYKTGLGDKVKNLAFTTLDITDKKFKSADVKPGALLKFLVSIFSHIRDVTIDEAKRILGFFKEHEETEAYFLFIYFAEFNQDTSFDTRFFKEKLKEMCIKRNPFKEWFSREFWRMANNDKEKEIRSFDKIESYWKLLFSEYQPEIYKNLYRTLEITLTWPDKYNEHKELFKDALKKEIAYYRERNEEVPLWQPGGEIFQILKEHSNDDFLEVFLYLLENVDDNIRYCGIVDWILMFKSIKPMTKSQKKRCNMISSKLRDYCPELFQD